MSELLGTVETCVSMAAKWFPSVQFDSSQVGNLLSSCTEIEFMLFKPALNNISYIKMNQRHIVTGLLIA